MGFYEESKQLILDIIKRGPRAIIERLFAGETNILFLGIDNAGKTTLLLRLKSDTIHTVAPTLSVREEPLQIGNMRVLVSDLGGHHTARMGWNKYFMQSQGIIFLIDITDEERYPIVKETYQDVLYEIEKLGRRSLPIAVLFNKTDTWQQYWETRHKGEPVPPLDEAYLHYLCQLLGIVIGEGEDGRRVTANFCSVVTDSISTTNKGFMLAFKWLDMMVRNDGSRW
ncbi:GTP-binding protein SAR1 [Nematocida sp. AWRm80]|nr:GTP-binding protein SAR1 [Nematocida sp. AWRm80]